LTPKIILTFTKWLNLNYQTILGHFNRYKHQYEAQNLGAE
jgi:hypothetical protein